MLTIGEFARLGNVSVRMLRHYDALGVLVPARTDPWSGYRSYRADQLTRLNRLVALKDLGFTLDQVRSILDDEVTADELRGMLRLRRAELAERIAADTARLARVEARLRTIESEDTMSDQQFEIRPVPAVRLAELSEQVEGVEGIGAVVGPLYGRLGGLLAAAGAHVSGPAVAWYEVADSGRVTVHAGLPFAGAPAVPGADVVELPAADQAAVVVHHGSMAGIGDTWQSLMRWVERNGWVPAGPGGREVYLHTPDGDQSDWVTEIQQPVTPATT